MMLNHQCKDMFWPNMGFKELVPYNKLKQVF